MMMNNRLWHIVGVLLVAIALTVAFPGAAFANADGADTDTTTIPAVESVVPEESKEPEPPAVPVPLTPDGNLTLVDDISGSEAGDKQFITVITKSGNYFYLVIDRAGDSENVYFLNLVDETDLMALLEDADAAMTTTPGAANTTPEPVAPQPEPTPEPEPEGGINMGLILAVIALLALGGGGALLYIKVLKPKSGASGKVDISELDEYGYGDELDDFISEPDELDFAESNQDTETDGAAFEDGDEPEVEDVR